MPFFPPFFGFCSFFVLNIPILSPIIYNRTLIIYNRDVDFKGKRLICSFSVLCLPQNKHVNNKLDNGAHTTKMERSQNSFCVCDTQTQICDLCLCSSFFPFQN